MAKLRQEEMLRAVLHRNRALKLEPREEGLLLVVPMRRPWWSRGPVRWLFPISSERRMQLDSVGSYVLSLVDGRRTIENVIENLMQRYNLSFHEARVSVFEFMKTLMSRGAIGIHLAERGEVGSTNQKTKIKNKRSPRRHGDTKKKPQEI